MTQSIKEFTTIDADMLMAVEGGKYYGNGVYSDPYNGVQVDWGRTIVSIGNNSTANLLTGGNAGWNSRY
ncbi:hypothetical protein ACVR0S_01150 [Streptococcus dentapri]|uniref:Bacteriocin n=1 Tax=Streptococcus dentapri TaxID=573564 RepID=A0ABV8D0A9_9STRE